MMKPIQLHHPNSLFQSKDMQPQNELQTHYTLGPLLGTGGFGFVMAATENETGQEKAVKCIIKSKIPSTAWQSGLPIEIYLLQQIRHPNIIEFCQVYQDNLYFYLVMELHGHPWASSLTRRIPSLSQSTTESLEEDEDQIRLTRRVSCDLFECIEHHKYFKEPRAKMIFRQVVEAVAYLDRLGICHRDIKDENIVIDENYKVKLIDFGSSVVLPQKNRQRHRLTRFYGTVSFASPEILLSQPYRAEPAEVWSLGVLLFTLVFGEIPFPDGTAAIESDPVQSRIPVSDACFHLIHSLLQKNPNHRPTIHHVLNHAWLN